MDFWVDFLLPFFFFKGKRLIGSQTGTLQTGTLRIREEWLEGHHKEEKGRKEAGPLWQNRQLANPLKIVLLFWALKLKVPVYKVPIASLPKTPKNPPGSLPFTLVFAKNTQENLQNTKDFLTLRTLITLEEISRKEQMKHKNTQKHTRAHTHTPRKREGLGVQKHILLGFFCRSLLSKQFLASGNGLTNALSSLAQAQANSCCSLSGIVSAAIRLRFGHGFELCDANSPRNAKNSYLCQSLLRPQIARHHPKPQNFPKTRRHRPVFPRFSLLVVRNRSWKCLNEGNFMLRFVWQRNAANRVPKEH